MRTAASELRLVGVAGVIGALLACQSDYDISGEPPDVDPGDVTECGFTPVSGTVISSYDCNPVFSSSAAGAEVSSVGFLSTPVVEHPFYQIWYVASTSGGYDLRYAISPDGTNWEEHPNNPVLTSQNNVWDQDSMDAVQVVWDPTQSRYVMVYQGVTFPQSSFDTGSWGLGAATSPDGVSWTKHPANPVVDFVAMQSDLFSTDPIPCWPLALQQTEFGLTSYLSAGVVDIFSGEEQACEVWSATTTNLADWNFGGAPLVRAGGPYDTEGIAGAAVVELDGTQYMFYIGFEEWVVSTGYRSSKGHNLLVATSTNGGETWQKQPDPLPISLSPEGLISGIGAQVIGDRIHLWVTDFYEAEDGQAIGYFLYEPGIDPHP